MAKLVTVLGLILAMMPAAAPAGAQEPVVRPSEPIPIDSLPFGPAPADTVPVLAPRLLASGGLETLARVPSEDLLPRNPRNAALRAFVLPGWGQFYTGHPWRGIFFAAAEVGFLAAGYHQQLQALDLQDSLEERRVEFFAALPDSVAADTVAATQAFDDSPAAILIRSELEDLEQTREDFYAYFALSVIFAAVDAYVAAQLDPIDVGIEPSTGRVSAGLRFDIGNRAGEP